MAPLKSVLAVTMGDPAGIGPEVLLKALGRRPSWLRARVVVIGDRAVLAQTARRLRRRVPSWPVIEVDVAAAAGADGPAGASSVRFDQPVTLLDCRTPTRLVPGRPSRLSGAASLRYLDRAIELWRARRIHALVTAPVTKWAIASVEPGFTGQTEYLARAMRRRDVVMMFVSDRLRVVVATRHIPLRRVSGAVDRRLLRTTIRMTDEALRRHFGIARPALALCGLNPHAGEEGTVGLEERATLRPVLRELRREGLRCDGPFAADGLFARPIRYDAVICGYHDQGLIPFKMAAGQRGCQLSVGLPIVRTSPDHGSALEIAGQGIADPTSMRYALRLAARLASCSPPRR